MLRCLDYGGVLFRSLHHLGCPCRLRMPLMWPPLPPERRRKAPRRSRHVINTYVSWRTLAADLYQRQAGRAPGLSDAELVSWIFDPLQKSSERFEYFFRGFRPDEWPGVFVPFVHPGQDVLLELPDGLVHPAAQ